jgi:tight adherence protein C
MLETVVAVGAVFTFVLVVCASVTTTVLARRSPARRRVMTLSTPLAASGLIADSRRLVIGPDEKLRKASTYIPKSPREMSRLQRKLAAAGYHGTPAVLTYCFAELGCAVLGLLLPIGVFGLRGGVFGLLGAFIGYSIPSIVVRRKITQRKKQVENGLPDALDLLIVCVEAGLAIDQAILKAAEELGIAYPALGEELRMINIETRAGKSRIEAFKNFARRTQVDDVRSLVAMLVQTDRFGTSIAQALRTHAEVSRSKRKQRAEEKAAKLGVKLVFPLVFCLLPAFFVVSLGPAIIKRFAVTTISFGVLFVVSFALYLMRRRSRIRAEDNF